MCRRLTLHLLFGTSLALAPAVSSAGAQTMGTPARHSFVAAGVGEMWVREGEALFMAGVKTAWYRPNSLGVELGLGIFPQYFGLGGIFVPEAGPTYQVLLGDALLILRAGVAPAVAVGGGIGFAGVMGEYAGAGVLVPVGPLALRLDLTRRFYEGGLWSFGIGITARPSFLRP